MKGMKAETSRRRPRVVHVVTSSVTTRLMLGQLGALREAGANVYLVSNPGPELELVAAQEQITGVPVPMEREISLRRDLLSLWQLWRTFRKLQPDLVNAGTAKAGLLAGLAAAAAGVPCRVYTVHGLRLETLKGVKRRVLMLAERISCRCAHRVLCVSESVRRRVVEFKLSDFGRTCLLGAGSFNGIHYERFAPSPERRAEAATLRAALGFPAAAPVIGFVGRLTRDKGISELVAAFQLLQRHLPEVRLLLMGRYEEADPVPIAVREAIESDPHIAFTGYLSDPAPYYHVMDVLALPTYREGFPTVGLEAASAGKPVVSTFATGAVDAVIDGETGILVPVGEARALAEALRLVLEERALAARHGTRGAGAGGARLPAGARVAGFRGALSATLRRAGGGVHRGSDVTASAPGPGVARAHRSLSGWPMWSVRASG